MRALLRITAVIVAVLAALDPPVQTSRARRVPVRFELTAPRKGETAAAVRDRLLHDLRDVIDVTGERPPAAVVIIGDAASESLPSEPVPISTVSLVEELRPNVRITRLPDPDPAASGQVIAIDAEFEAIGMGGETSVLTAVNGGTVVARTEHRWSRDRERFRARLGYAPPAGGLHVVTVAAQPLDRERTATDNEAEAALVVEDRPLRVLAFEPRPSWSATFVRRALETDARFAVESIVRSSRGIAVRSRNAPGSLVGHALDEFDVVIAGAPEELAPAELDAIDRFARDRGGAVVFLPDRRPSGPFASRLPAGRLVETLVESPVRLANAPGVSASELLVAGDAPAGVATIAAIDRPGEPAPVSISWVQGAGRMMLWGALDAWRYRAEGGDGFARFWRATVADLAVGAAPPVHMSVVPRIAAVNERVVVRATVRPSELGGSQGRIDVPSVSASAETESGETHPIRLWPTAEVGVFEGETTLRGYGTHEVVVTAGSDVGRTPFAIVPAPRHPVRGDPAALRLIAESTGGVHVAARDLGPLERHLRGLTGEAELTTGHPLRSPWWFLPLAAGLAGEWTLRRRRGLK